MSIATYEINNITAAELAQENGCKPRYSKAMRAWCCPNECGLHQCDSQCSAITMESARFRKVGYEITNEVKENETEIIEGPDNYLQTQSYVVAPSKYPTPFTWCGTEDCVRGELVEQGT